MRRLMLCLALYLGLSCTPAYGLEPFREPEVFFQVSTLEALLAGSYDGQMSLHELSLHGDVGLGTFDRLDGEMIVLYGTFYQVRADGAVVEADLDETTPFAQLTPFEADVNAEIGGAADMAALTAVIDQHMTGRNQFYAILITGAFPYVKTRSVPAQDKPYPPLAQVVTHQSVFEFHDVEGTVVGLYNPDFVGPMGVPGYHLHFLTADRTGGGHVLELAVGQAVLQLDATHEFRLVVPGSGEFQAQDFDVEEGAADAVEH